MTTVQSHRAGVRARKYRISLTALALVVASCAAQPSPDIFKRYPNGHFIIYHPWIKDPEGGYSPPYYTDYDGKWMCGAHVDGTPDRYPCDGTGLGTPRPITSHDHTLPPLKLADGSVIGGQIRPDDPPRPFIWVDKDQ
jgi:hypothetical protein